jgi:hypothetical protein
VSVAPLEVLFTEIGVYLIAVDARHVRGVGDRGLGDAASRSGVAVDLAERLGQGQFPGAWPRRVLEVGTSRGPIDVVAGEEVWPGTIAAGGLQEIPGLVAGHLEGTGIRHLLVQDDDRFVYVVDPEALR